MLLGTRMKNIHMNNETESESQMSGAPPPERKKPWVPPHRCVGCPRKKFLQENPDMVSKLDTLEGFSLHRKKLQTKISREVEIKCKRLGENCTACEHDMEGWQTGTNLGHETTKRNLLCYLSRSFVVRYALPPSSWLPTKILLKFSLAASHFYRTEGGKEVCMRHCLHCQNWTSHDGRHICAKGKYVVYTNDAWCRSTDIIEPACDWSIEFEPVLERVRKRGRSEERDSRAEDSGIAADAGENKLKPNCRGYPRPALEVFPLNELTEAATAALGMSVVANPSK